MGITATRLGSSEMEEIKSTSRDPLISRRDSSGFTADHSRAKSLLLFAVHKQEVVLAGTAIKQPRGQMISAPGIFGSVNYTLSFYQSLQLREGRPGEAPSS